MVVVLHQHLLALILHLLRKPRRRLRLRPLCRHRHPPPNPLQPAQIDILSAIRTDERTRNPYKVAEYEQEIDEAG